MIKFLKNLYNKKRMTRVEKYLAESKDLVELERRQKELQYKGIWI